MKQRSEDQYVVYVGTDTIVKTSSTATVTPNWGHASVFRLKAASPQKTYELSTTKHALLKQLPDNLWIKFSQIKVGDIIETLDGPARVQLVQSDGYVPVQEVALDSATVPHVVVNKILCSSASLDRTKRPVSSYGLVAFQCSPSFHIRYLVIRRKNSMGFMDLIRGRYCHQEVDSIVRVYLTEMTSAEREMLLAKSFDQLWDIIWSNRHSKSYRQEYLCSKFKYEKLNVRRLLTETESHYTEPEYGFPKGRRNTNESVIECAEREFQEETGLGTGDYELLNDVEPFEECYVATNGVSYRHVYFLARIKPDVVPQVNRYNQKQMEEIDAIGVYSQRDCFSLFRDYDSAKRSVLLQADRAIRKHYHRTWTRSEPARDISCPKSKE